MLTQIENNIEDVYTDDTPLSEALLGERVDETQDFSSAPDWIQRMEPSKRNQLDTIPLSEFSRDLGKVDGFIEAFAKISINNHFDREVFFDHDYWETIDDYSELDRHVMVNYVRWKDEEETISINEMVDLVQCSLSTIDQGSSNGLEGMIRKVIEDHVYLDNTDFEELLICITGLRILNGAE